MARPKSKTKSQANYAYDRANYARFTILFPIQARESLKAKAEEAGQSMNRYILEALEARSGLKLTLDNALPWMNSEKKK